MKMISNLKAYMIPYLWFQIPKLPTYHIGDNIYCEILSLFPGYWDISMSEVQFFTLLMLLYAMILLEDYTVENKDRFTTSQCRELVGKLSLSCKQ